ncbi:MAG: peptidylprolyl isomerase [Calditrichaeota bacterium]|nr:MAG: peptidylprolyl isomerase [Calditrichota bacterium]
MQIENQMVVSLHYTLTDQNGNILDSSDRDEPLSFLTGAEQIIPGLEKEILGMKLGEKKRVVVMPEEAYGERDERMVQEIKKKMIPHAERLQVGEVLQGEGDDGHLIEGHILEVNENSVIIDFNHPLAGEILHFDTEIIHFRPASAEEIEHGHVH